METFYIFGFGVLTTLFILFIIYGVKLLLTLKKEVDEVSNDMEESLRNISDIEADLSSKIEEVNLRLDTEINEFGKVIAELNKLINNKN